MAQQTLKYSYEFPTATAEHVFQQGIREDYNQAEAPYLDHQEFELLALKNGEQGGGATMRYKVDTNLPSWAKKILPARNTVTETHTWPGPAADGSRTYTFDVDVANVPAKAKGSATITPTGPSSCRVDTEIVITANMPLVGSKLADLVARDLGPTVEGKFTFMEKWLGEGH